jgi:hypothetical protein
MNRRKSRQRIGRLNSLIATADCVGFRHSIDFNLQAPYSPFANRELGTLMILKPQDLLVLLKLVALDRINWSYASLAVDLGMSPSEVHAAVKRALGARLAVTRDGSVVPVLSALDEFISPGLSYVFVPDRGELTRGMPTAHAAPPLNELFISSSEPPPVWPDPEGETRGMAFSPLYTSAPKAARNDPKLYELLALVDAIRGGRARERAVAIKMLDKKLISRADAQNSSEP